jgi:hypothetical protein
LDDDAAIRAQVARAVGPQSLLSDQDPRVRAQAGTNSAWHNPAEFFRLLSDRDPWVRFAARIAVRERLASGVVNPNDKEIVSVALSGTEDGVTIGGASPDPRLREEGWLIFPPALDAKYIRATGGAKTRNTWRTSGWKRSHL